MTGPILIALTGALAGGTAVAAAVALLHRDEIRRMAAERAALTRLRHELDELLAMYPAEPADTPAPLRWQQRYAFELAVLVATVRGHLRPDWRTT